MGQERKGLGRKAGRRKAAVSLRRREAKPKTQSQSKSRLVGASPDKTQNAEIARLARELKEALAQQSASSDVLAVINSSPGNLRRVFEAIVDKALEICDAGFGGLWIVEGELARPAATRNVPKAYNQFLKQQSLPLIEAFGSGIEDKPFNHVADLARTESYRACLPLTVASVELGGIRSYLAVPLRDGGVLAGVLSVYRKQVRPFSSREIALLRGFAVQAEIAMKNARLLKETQDGLEQQTATSDILKVIAGSPSNVRPVFEAMLDKAISLCGAKFGTLFLYDGKGFTLAADRNLPRDYIQAVRGRSFSPEGNAGFRFLVERKSTFHIPDIFTDASYARGEVLRKVAVELGGVRSLVAVPLLKNGELIGNFSIYRKNPGGFAENQIALVENFADQAVIAIENARLFNETREALEQQTATAEVLRIISSSPRDLKPVFEAMLGKAMRICDAKFGHILLYDGERFHATYLHDVPQAYRAFWDKHGPIRGNPKTGLGQIARTKQVVHIPDLKLESAYAEREPLRIVTVDEAGARSFLAVPMLKEKGLIGAIVIYRQEVRPFTEKQIELVKNFADQAVIAIENARLFEEVQARTRDLEESLQHQTATSQILSVISSSKADIQPVFDAIVGSAARLFEPCGATITTLNDGKLYWCATAATLPEFDAERTRAIYPLPFDPQRSPSARALQQRQIIEIPDISAPDTPEFTRKAAAAGGFQSVTFVPLIRQDKGIGTIILTHLRAGFRLSEKQLALVKTFADQAVIAIENAQLFEEVQAKTSDLEESLQQQTATAEVLKVITRSTFNVQAVLDTLVESATRLCDAQDALIFLPSGNLYRAAARYGFTPEYHQYIGTNPIEIDRGSVVGRTVIDKQLVHISDVLTDPDYTRFDAQKKAGYRAVLGTPLLREGNVVGVIFLTRTRPQPFTDKQIELVKTFADQAVIAIENARLFDEVQAKTRDLEESLQQQTATAEVLQMISSSPGELGPVFAAVIEKATRLCDAGFGTLFRFEGDAFYFAADIGTPPALANYVRRPGPFRGPPGGMVNRIHKTKQIQHTHDYAADANPGLAATLGGARSTLGVPILKDDALVGAIVIYRKEIRPFSEPEIALVRSFASQAAIAIENARLFNETKEALERQTATAEILQVIASSPSDVQPVFDAIATRANSLIGGFSSTVFLFVDGVAHLRAFTPTTVEADEVLKSTFPRPVADFPPFQMAQAGKVTQIPDTEVLTNEIKNVARARGYRSMLFAPLMNRDVSIGFIAVTRVQPGNFAEHHVQLLQTFADQAVIAIENARLFDEVQAKTRDLTDSLQQQTATAEVLKVISRSAFDLQTVLDTLVESAVTLSGARTGTIFQKRGDLYHLSAEYGYTPEMLEYGRAHPIAAGIDSNVGRTALTGSVVQIPDVLADLDFKAFGYQRVGHFRAMLGIPIIREGTVEGVFSLAKPETGLFAPRQVELVQTFADQALIAIENARLFDEVQAKTRDLEESLQQQTATAEVLKVISSSSGDLKPVFESILVNATQICDAKFGILFLSEGDVARVVAMHGVTEEYAEARRREPIVVPGKGTALHLASSTRQPVQIADIRAEPAYLNDPRRGAILDLAGARTIMGVPIVMDDKLVGIINIYRTEVRPFTDKQVELVKNFAAQAVIAIENSRLLNELRESLQQQTATAEVLKVISRSTFDLPAVLHALVETAAQLCDADKGTITRQRNGAFYRAESCGFSEDFMNYVRDVPVVVDRHTATGRALLEGVVVHIPDVQADPEYNFGQGPRLGDYRALLGVPMLRQGVAIGVITLTRTEPRAFTDKQIELATTFADQAAIAIQNVRLFDEVQTRTQELSRSLENLRAAQDRLVQTEKLASLGQLTAGIAHEIKNPLNFVNNFSALSAELVDEMDGVLAEAKLEREKRGELDEIRKLLKSNLEKVVQHGKRADSIVKNMLLHSRSGSGERRPVEINAIIDESLNLAYHGARAEKQGFNITLEREFDPSAGTADVYPQEITRVLLNLVSNGFYAATKRAAEVGNGFEPRLKAASKSLGDRVEIRIRDNGAGIPSDIREKIFNPFFTTKPAGEGTGLGLSMSHDIVVKQHGGTIDIATEPGTFTEFIITLPRTAPAQAGAGEQKN